MDRAKLIAALIGEQPNAAFGTGSPGEEAQKPSGLAALFGGAYNALGDISKRAFGASETMRTEGTYDPTPMVEAAMLPMGTGAVAGVPMRAGEAVLGSGLLRSKPVRDETVASLKEMDRTLPNNVQDAITDWVGGPHNALEIGHKGGASYRAPLNDAYSGDPRAFPKYVEMGRNLDSVMQPVRDTLRKEYGDYVTLYRSQGKVSPNDEPRHLLSFTSDKAVADKLTGAYKDHTTEVVNVPVDSIAYITDRFGQKEFIVKAPGGKVPAYEPRGLAAIKTNP
jgi:hypothetical protein